MSSALALLRNETLTYDRRATGPEMEQDVPSTLDSFMGAKHFGRVMYVHGGALDYPVAVIRSEYSDSLPNAAVLYPLSNHKGQFDMGLGVGTCASIAGRTYHLVEPIGELRTGTDTAIDMQDHTQPIDYCVEVDWPGKKSFSSDDVAGALKSGDLSPADVPVDYIVRDGNTLILNTRSAQALERAGIPRSQWNAVNRTGQDAYEARLSEQLRRNNLSSEGTPNVTSNGN